MNQVSCRTTAAISRSLVTRGIDAGHMAYALPFGLDTLEDLSARIAWDDFLKVLENVAELVPGPDGVEDLCSTFYPQNDGLLKDLGSHLLSPRALYHMGARWYGPWLYPCTDAHCEDLSDGRIRQTIRILPDHTESELFFRAMSGGLRTVPTMLGLPPAVVAMERERREATYTITPPRIGRLERLRRFMSRRFGDIDGADEELAIHFDELQKGYEQARELSAEIGETTRRLGEEREERERIEQVLQRAQKLDTMGRLAGGIVHDFNNVLTAISGYAELALDQLDGSHPVHDDVAEIQEVAERGAALVQQILGFSRRRQVRPRRLELNAAALRLQTLLERLLPESIELQIRPAEEPVPVTMDPGQLEQVVINLVINARDAMPGGGRVRLALSREMSAEEGEVARIELSDTGRGMSAETAARAFEPFFTTKAGDKGTGLGLATVQGIVTGSGGRIDLSSTVGEGTRVTIELPIARPEADTGAIRPGARPAPPGGTETVLVVEDDDTVRGVLERTLAAAGYTVLSAAEGQTAMDLARNHPTDIELLVTDVGLPEEDGAALATRIYDLRAELRGALLITGHGVEDVTFDAPANHARLAKPFDRPTLLRTARRILDA